MNSHNQSAYLAPIGFSKLLLSELKNVVGIYDRLVLAEGPVQDVYWVENIWLNPSLIPIRSISHAAQTMRALQRNWWPYEFQHFRRMRLIQEKLPSLSARPLAFLAPAPASPLGSWTLIDESTLLMASQCSSPVPQGVWNFNEDRINPPSRAYLKLWEFFSRFHTYPLSSESCLELGASPGGWTWVLSQLAHRVIACDKSPLDPRIMALPNVVFKAQDAFKAVLADYADISWIFSDVVCYPDKLYDFVKNLLQKFPDKKYVFTIKFQGSNHSDVISRFASLPGQLVHLSHNKHELTWFKV